MSADILLIGQWRTFRAGEPGHRVAARVDTQLATECGLVFHQDCAKPMGKPGGKTKGRQCRNCRRIGTHHVGGHGHE